MAAPRLAACRTAGARTSLLDAVGVVGALFGLSGRGLRAWRREGQGGRRGRNEQGMDGQMHSAPGRKCCMLRGGGERRSSVRRRRPEEGGRGAERDDGLVALPMFRNQS